MRVGEYNSVRELRRSGAASLWEVEGGGGNGGGGNGEAKRAAKVLQPPAFWSDEERRQRVARFLARAGVQGRAAAAGAHWAPVHASGEDEHGAHYVTDLYPGSAEQLIRKPRTAMDGAGLYRVVRGVVAGLTELREGVGRAHGRLSPGNVLLTSENPGAASVALADPAVEASGGEAGDCRAVGELIFALVERRMPRAEETAKGSPAWRALGPRAGRWGELCNRLLDPAAPLESLDELRREVERCRPPKVSPGRLVRVGVVAVLVVGSVAGIFTNWHRKHAKHVADWGALCDAAPWLNQFVLEVNHGSNVDVMIGGAEELKGDLILLRGAPQVQLDELRGHARPSEPPRTDPPEDLGKIGQVESAMRRVEAVRKMCSESGWPPLQRAKDLGNLDLGGAAGRVVELSAKANYVIQAGKWIGNPSQGSRPDGGTLALDLRDLILARGWFEPLHKLAEVQKRIVALAAEVDGDVGENFQRASRRAMGADGPEDLIVLLELAPQIEARLGDLKSKEYDAKQFSLVAKPTLKGQEGRAYLEQWVRQVPGYRILRRDENPLETRDKVNWSVSPEEEAAAAKQGTIAVGRRPPVSWRDLLVGMEGVGGDIEANAKSYPQLAKEGQTALDALKVQQAALLNRVPLVKDKEGVKRDLDQFISQARTIRRKLLPDDPEEVAAFRNRLSAEIDSLKGDDLIQAARARELSGLRESGWRLERMKARLAELNSFFADLRSEPPLTAADGVGHRDWTEEVSKAARAEHEDVVRRALLKAFPPGAAPQDGSKLSDVSEAARKELDEWLSRAETSVRAAAELEDRLDEYGTKDESGGGGRPSLKGMRAKLDGADPKVLKALAPVTRRADALIGVWELDGKQVGEKLRNGKLEEAFPVLDAQLAAWRRGADRSIPLAVANAARAGLVARLKERGGKAAGPEVINGVEKVWRENVAWPQIAAPPDATVLDVLAEADRLIGEKSLPESGLTPAGRYNLAVYRLVEAAAGRAKMRDADLELIEAKAVEAASDAKRSVRLGVDKTGDRAHEALTRFTDAVARAGQVSKPSPDEAGPAGAGWEEHIGDTGAAYTKGGSRLDFVYVESAECYLSKTEVSIELVNEVLSRTELAKLPADTGEGPRVWVKEQNRLVPAGDWFQALPGPTQAYAPAAGDWGPGVSEHRSLKYPIQWVAPRDAENIAGSLKCKLPTISQWTAALEAELKVNPGGKWNVRDRKSWQAHVAYVGKFPATNDSNPARWPVIGDAVGAKTGVNDFWTTDNNGALPLDGVGQKPYEDDGHLFFQAVDCSEQGRPFALVGQGKLFDHLIGNVAEYVVDEKHRFFAMGGSAISPPMPLNKPVPIDPQLAGRGYCDVGIRLAFKAPPRLWRRLVTELGEGRGCYITTQ